MSQIPVQKTVFNKDQYSRVIDTLFGQFTSQGTEEELSFTVDDFFELYDQLFYQIPRDGETDSHQYILQREADYLGISLNQDDIQALLDEITSLRQQVLDTQTVVNELTKATNNI
jgi:Flp pilus assembly CpaE family ATPase